MCAATVAGGEDDYCPHYPVITGHQHNQRTIIGSLKCMALHICSTSPWAQWSVDFESVIRAPLKIYNFSRALTLAGWQRGISQNICIRCMLFNLKTQSRSQIEPQSYKNVCTNQAKQTFKICKSCKDMTATVVPICTVAFLRGMTSDRAVGSCLPPRYSNQHQHYSGMTWHFSCRVQCACSKSTLVVSTHDNVLQYHNEDICAYALSPDLAH